MRECPTDLADQRRVGRIEGAHGHRLVGSVLLYPPDGRVRRPGPVTG